MREDMVCGVADALQPDDEILINERSRPLRVLGFEEQTNGGFVSGSDYPYHILHLRGNGTEYRLRWSHTGDYYPHLHTESELQTREGFNYSEREVQTETIAKGRGEDVLEISVVGVPDDRLDEWALARNIVEVDG